ncbi:MAG TPA: hypothetical protein PKA30_08560, partial [Accumulibacter sp.]|uniref:hypothetical protein n=1 Tax=Accumulibacter sp. TaxID=2053492 RepID=UPI002BCC0568
GAAAAHWRMADRAGQSRVGIGANDRGTVSVRVIAQAASMPWPSKRLKAGYLAICRARYAGANEPTV